MTDTIPASGMPKTLEALASAAVAEHERLRAVNEAEWHRSKAASLKASLAESTIRWSLPEMDAVARAELIGTWAGDGFVWGWDHPSVETGQAPAAAALKAHADAHGIEELRARTVDCDLPEAIELAKIAVLAGGLQGFQRVETSGGWAFLGFSDVRLEARP